MKFSIINFALGFLFAGVFAPLSVFGDTPTNLPPTNFRFPSISKLPVTGSDLLDRIGLIGNWIFAIFLAISIIYIVLAAFEFVTGAGEPAKVSGARMKLIYAAVGIGVALLAAGIDDIVRSIVVNTP
ncbi:MAG: hypothetical protein HY482_02360 [Candidatus Wildermuthbacteria bacterium]|nr:hypothetical protein [Candidatus Wildermuthbacteria bacterium]